MAITYMLFPCPCCGGYHVIPRWGWPSNEYFCTDCHEVVTHPALPEEEAP